MLNNKRLAYSPKDTPCVMQTKFSKTVMVFGCVSCEGDVMPPDFFREGLRLNSDAYVEFLITVVKPCITMVGHMYGSMIQLPATPLVKVKMVVREFLRLHQSQCLASELPRSFPHGLLCMGHG